MVPSFAWINHFAFIEFIFDFLSFYFFKSQKFCNILVGTIWPLLLMLLPRSWRWQTMLDFDDTKLAWYSPSATFLICLDGLKPSLGICGCKPTWPCLIAKVFATQLKFLNPSGYCTVINCIFIFCTTNVFSCFSSVMAHLELVKHKFRN